MVVVPPTQLHWVPWALLPSLRERVLSVSPSASSWLRAREAEPPPGGRQVLVRGPGLATGGAEVTHLADRYSVRSSWNMPTRGRHGYWRSSTALAWPTSLRTARSARTVLSFHRCGRPTGH